MSKPACTVATFLEGERTRRLPFVFGQRTRKYIRIQIEHVLVVMYSTYIHCTFSLSSFFRLYAGEERV